MRRFIIDTDAGTDDAAAILMALAYKEVEFLGITVVFGNVPLRQAVKNALQIVEVTGKNIPVYIGAEKPSVREAVTAEFVHGSDGMGDADLVHPTNKAEEKNAVDFILETVAANPNEIEIIALGPVTNIAEAIKKSPEIMKKVKCIWSMGTAGFGRGNCSPVAEFNVFCDAESYQVMLESGIPMTIIGFDLCLGDADITAEDIEEIAGFGSKAGNFFVKSSMSRYNYNHNVRKIDSIDLPDAIAVAVALEPEIVTKSVGAYCYCCTLEKPAYGQVIVHEKGRRYSVGVEVHEPNAKVIAEIDGLMFRNAFKNKLK